VGVFILLTFRFGISVRYFAAYEVSKKALTPAGSAPSDLNVGAIILSGGLAGVAMWSIAIPPDVS
jgi:solute carrier family 25 carnitine/acylcarnitine transporter 20/29